MAVNVSFDDLYDEACRAIGRLTVQNAILVRELERSHVEDTPATEPTPSEP